MYRSEHKGKIQTIKDKIVRAELERQIDERLDECEIVPLHTLLPQETDICHKTIAEKIVNSREWEEMLIRQISYEVDLRFDSVKEELIEARKEKAEEREYQAAHMPSLS